MELIKSVLSIIATLIAFAAGVEGLQTATEWLAGESVKSHKRGVISLQKWNNQLQGQSTKK